MQIYLYQKLFITFLVLSTAMNSLLVYGQDSDDKKKTKQQLSQLQDEITKKKSDISQARTERNSLQKALKKDELAISNNSKNLHLTQKKQDEISQEILSLKKQKGTLEQSKDRQEKALSDQLRAAYSSGHHDYLKLLLNQENPAKVQRTLSYYQYMNNARIGAIETFEKTINDIEVLDTKLQARLTELAKLEQQQIEQKQALAKNKQTRARTLKKINKHLLSSQQQLNKLKAEEDNLVVALQKLAEDARKQIDLVGLGQLRGKLFWPVKGKIRHSFGSRKQGYLKWKGVLLNAPVGRQVSTIHSGTVLFADWLKGYGLVTVVDHGEGYMSLYGHNQTLLKSVGDRVETGEAIALTGQSGGQSSAGLYFEIRQSGKAVNPKLWCR